MLEAANVSKKTIKDGLNRVRPLFITCDKIYRLVEVELVKHITKSLCFFNGNGNALTHLLVIGRPGADVVHGLSLVPADEVELLVPAVVAFANYADLVNYFILDFRHFGVLLM